MTNTIDPVQAAILQAQQAAANSVPATVTPQQSTAVAAAGNKPSLADFSNMASVDLWLKVKEGGLQIGDDPKFHETLKVQLDFADIDVFYSASGGNPAQYEKSRDRVLSESGKPWSQALNDLSKYAGKQVRDFLSATLPFTLLDDAQGRNSKVEAGTVIGYTLPYTGAQEFAKLQKKMVKEGWSVDDGIYEVTLSSIPAKNGAGNNYGKIQFLDIRPIED